MHIVQRTIAQSSLQGSRSGKFYQREPTTDLNESKLHHCMQCGIVNGDSIGKLLAQILYSPQLVFKQLSTGSGGIRLVALILVQLLGR